MTNRSSEETPDVPGEQTPLSDGELEPVAGGMFPGTGTKLSAAPSVCVRPTPVGPVPIPYPVTTSVSSDLPSAATKTKP